MLTSVMARSATAPKPIRRRSNGVVKQMAHALSTPFDSSQGCGS